MKKLPEILCSLCVDPGMCCRAFPLNHYFLAGTAPATILKWLRKMKFPFRPLRRMAQWTTSDFTDDDGKRLSGVMIEQWQFTCTKLGRNGRCTIYKNRPELCRIYEAGCDMMCVHVRGDDGRPRVPQRAAP